MRAVDFVTRLINSAKLSNRDYRRVLMHRISGEEKLAKLTASSCLIGKWSFFEELKDLGRATAKNWLARNYDAVGVRGTLSLKLGYS